MKVALCPKTDLNTLATGIVAKLLQVLYVTVQGTCLTITCTITIVGKEPAQGEVVVKITVDSSTGRELIVVLLTVQSLLHTTVVLLALLVELAVLIRHLDVVITLCLLCPEVAVVSIQVTLIETELGQQDWITCQLIEVVQQGYGTFVHHHEDIQIVGIVIKHGILCLGITEIITAGLESVPHHTITACAPIVWSRATNTTIHPVVGVHDGNELALVRETAVLHTTTEEVIVLVLGELHGCAFLAKLCGHNLIYDDLATLQSLNLTSLGVHLYNNLLCSKGCSLSIKHHLTGIATRVVHQDLCLGTCLRVTDDTTVGILENTEGVRTIEVHIHTLSAIQGHLCGSLVEHTDAVCPNTGSTCQQSRQHDNLTHSYLS